MLANAPMRSTGTGISAVMARSLVAHSPVACSQHAEQHQNTGIDANVEPHTLMSRECGLDKSHTAIPARRGLVNSASRHLSATRRVVLRPGCPHQTPRDSA